MALRILGFVFKPEPNTGKLLDVFFHLWSTSIRIESRERDHLTSLRLDVFALTKQRVVTEEVVKTQSSSCEVQMCDLAENVIKFLFSWNADV